MHSMKLPVVNMTKIPSDHLKYLIGLRPCKSRSGEEPWNKNEVSCSFPEHSDNVDESHEHGRPVSWSNLPLPALEKIYYFSSREDRYQISLVCRRWWKAYESPSLWRNVDFYVKSSKRPCLEIAYAWKYGHLFRHVRIIYCEQDEEESMNCKKWLIIYLWALICRSRLLSISFMNKSYFSEFRFFDTFSGLFHNILELLRSQDTLRSMEIRDSYVDKGNLTHLLETTCSSNAETLKEVKLHFSGFYSVLDKTCFIDPNLDLSFIYSLLNLDVFEANYSRFFELLISELLKHNLEIDPELWKNAKLKRIKLLCDRNVANHCYYGCRGISATDWMHLKQICPELYVDLCMISFNVFYKDLISFVITPGIPLRSLKSNMKIDSKNIGDFLFEHLINSGSYNYLEEIDVSWSHCYVVPLSALVRFLLICPKLRIVKLKVPWPAFGLVKSLEYLLHNAPETLEAVSIIVTDGNYPECPSHCQNMEEHFKYSCRMSKVRVFISEDVSFIMENLRY